MISYIVIALTLLSLFVLNKLDISEERKEKTRYIIIIGFLMIILLLPKITYELFYDYNIETVMYIMNSPSAKSSEEISEICSKSTFEKIKQISDEYHLTNNEKLVIEEIIDGTIFVVNSGEKSKRFMFIFDNNIELNKELNLSYISGIRIYSIKND